MAIPPVKFKRGGDLKGVIDKSERTWRRSAGAYNYRRYVEVS